MLRSAARYDSDYLITACRSRGKLAKICYQAQPHYETDGGSQETSVPEKRAGKAGITYGKTLKKPTRKLMFINLSIIFSREPACLHFRLQFCTAPCPFKW